MSLRVIIMKKKDRDSIVPPLVSNLPSEKSEAERGRKTAAHGERKRREGWR